MHFVNVTQATDDVSIATNRAQSIASKRNYHERNKVEGNMTRTRVWKKKKRTFDDEEYRDRVSGIGKP